MSRVTDLDLIEKVARDDPTPYDREVLAMIRELRAARHMIDFLRGYPDRIVRSQIEVFDQAVKSDE